MERLINQKNASPTAIGQKPLASFAIANILLTLSIKATNLRISSQTTTTIA
jgi:hypothetical protein